MVVGALFLTLFASVVIAATINCADDRLSCYGTENADQITGTDSRDEIEALQSNDTANANGGDDSLQGSSGKGDMTGCFCQDDVFGGKGIDTIRDRVGDRDEIRCDGDNNDLSSWTRA